jgi:cullin 1
MKYVLLERNAKKWAQKQNAEGMAAEDQVFFNLHAKFMMTKIIEIVSKHQLTNFMQELLSKYASLKLE